MKKLGWTYVCVSGVNLDQPGILAYEIDGVGTYITYSNRMSKRIREYETGVNRLLSGDPYKPSQPAYRDVHHRLADATRRATHVTVRALENCPEGMLAERRAHWIADRGTLNGAT
jgi:hypothetical protein